MLSRKSNADRPDDARPTEASAGPEESQIRALPFHPLLFAAFPILALYAKNMGEIPIGEIWRPLGMALLGAAAVWLVVALLMRHVRKAALAASAVTLVFFSYGHLANLLPPHLRALVLPICAAILVIALRAVIRSRGRLTQVTGILNLTSAVLLAPSFATIATYMFVFATTSQSHAAAIAPLHAANASARPAPVIRRRKLVAAADAKDLPDIYYIILDAYGRADRLKTYYGYDNTPFVRALEERGFYVAPDSRSNYDQTGLCLASALSMSYIDTLELGRDRPLTDFDWIRSLIDDNAVAVDLSARGYHYVNIWTGSGQTKTETADLELDAESTASAAPRASGFERQVLGLSALDADPRARDSEYDRHRAFIRSGFAYLESVPSLPYPKFVFAHIEAPHPPFVFGPHGEAADPSYPYTDADGSQLLSLISRADYRAGYVHQLQYVNKRTLEAIDAILRKSRRRPIIIVQGDHGSRMNLNWESLAKTDVREPFSILNAYYVPPRVRRRLYDSITPVNSFRVLLSVMFGKDYALLPDRSFYSTSGDSLAFTDVTSRLGTPQGVATRRGRGRSGS